MWDEKSRRTMGKIRLTCEDGPRNHIKDATTAVEIWRILQRQHEKPSFAIFDRVLREIARVDQSHFSSIYESAEHMKQKASKCAVVGPANPGFDDEFVFSHGAKS